jgi:hypothetical protein
MANDPERKDIRSVRDNYLSLWSSQDFWCDVSRRPAFFIQQFFLSDPAGQPEIDNHVILGFVLIDSHHHVLQLKVSVGYSLLPEMLKPFGNIADCFEFLPVSSD